MGPENSRQSQFRDRDRILIFEARKFRRLENFGGYKKGSGLGNCTFTIKLSLNSGDPNNCYMNRKNKWVPGSNDFINEAKWPNPGFWVFTDFRLLIGQPPRWRRPKAHWILGVQVVWIRELVSLSRVMEYTAVHFRN
jgi:hypothetical protein